MIPIFSKLVNFCPHILTYLESLWEGILAAKILWAKVQKQKSYWVIKFWTSVPIFSKLVNFGPYISPVLESPRKCYYTPPETLTRKKEPESCGKVNFWTLVPMFSKSLNFGLHFFGISGKIPNGLRDLTILWTIVQKQHSYMSKTVQLWGWVTLGALSSKLKSSVPNFLLRTTLDS